MDRSPGSPQNGDVQLKRLWEKGKVSHTEINSSCPYWVIYLSGGRMDGFQGYPYGVQSELG